MSKRAEQAALEAVPVEYNGFIFGFSLESAYTIQRREGFQQGYEKAEKDLGWHSVKESLPPIDEEVIVAVEPIEGSSVISMHRIAIAHRPDINGWDGKSLSSGKVKHYVPETYDGWNIKGVTHWMYLPKLEEE